jgi:hypothetical protein
MHGLTEQLQPQQPIRSRTDWSPPDPRKARSDDRLRRNPPFTVDNEAGRAAIGSRGLRRKIANRRRGRRPTIRGWHQLCVWHQLCM